MLGQRSLRRIHFRAPLLLVGLTAASVVALAVAAFLLLESGGGNGEPSSLAAERQLLDALGAPPSTTLISEYETADGALGRTYATSLGLPESATTMTVFFRDKLMASGWQVQQEHASISSYIKGGNRFAILRYGPELSAGAPVLRVLKSADVPKDARFFFAVEADFAEVVAGRAPTLADPDLTGRQLVEAYMSLLAGKDAQNLRTFLSDAFLRQGAEGKFYTKEEYLKNLPQLGDYSISEVTARQAGDALVVRWLFSVTEVIDGRALRTEPAPRLATFVWSEGQWKLLSHANFNLPESDGTGATP